MVHLLKNIDFTLKSLHLFRIINWLLLDELHSTLKLSELVDAPTDFTVGAFSKFLFHFVMFSEGSVLFVYEADLRNLIHVSTTIDRWHRRSAWVWRSSWIRRFLWRLIIFSFLISSRSRLKQIIRCLKLIIISTFLFLLYIRIHSIIVPLSNACRSHLFCRLIL